MRIGIVGANGQVGTALSFLFREAGHDVVPVVRSPLAAARFDAAGFEYAVADPAGEEPPSVLASVDVVVVAAFAPYLQRGQYRGTEARRDNERIAENAVAGADRQATVVYFSSVAAFGGAVRPNGRWWYTREKRHVESVFSRAADAAAVDGYVFRLGHVFGPNQDVAERFRERLAAHPSVVVRADPDRPSNVVHTPTTRAAVLACAREGIEPGTYTVVDQPHWTWGEVVDRYAPADVDVRFAPSEGGGGWRDRLRGVATGILGRIPLSDEELYTVARLLPVDVAEVLFQLERRRRTGKYVESFKRNFEFHTHQFDYDPAPGPVVPGASVSPDRIRELEAEVRGVL